MWRFKKKKKKSIKESGSGLAKEAGRVGGGAGGETQEGGGRRGDWKEEVGGRERRIQLDNVTVRRTQKHLRMSPDRNLGLNQSERIHIRSL